MGSRRIDRQHFRLFKIDRYAGRRISVLRNTGCRHRDRRRGCSYMETSQLHLSVSRRVGTDCDRDKPERKNRARRRMLRRRYYVPAPGDEFHTFVPIHSSAGRR